MPGDQLKLRVLVSNSGNCGLFSFLHFISGAYLLLREEVHMHICIPNSQMFNTPMSEYQNAKTQIFKYLSTIVTHIYIASRWHYNKNK